MFNFIHHIGMHLRQISISAMDFKRDLCHSVLTTFKYHIVIHHKYSHLYIQLTDILHQTITETIEGKIQYKH